MFPRAVAEFNRFKNSYSKTVRRAVLVAAIAHLLLFVLAPPFNFKPYEIRAETPIVIVEVPNIVIPDLPKEIPRPPTDVEPSDDPENEAEFPETTFEKFDDIPPPPPPTSNGSSIGFVPFDELPELLSFDEPAYPELAREAGIEGRVVFKVTVGTDGRVVAATVHTSDVTESMAQAALESVKRARFKPAKQRHLPVKAIVYMPYYFRLR